LSGPLAELGQDSSVSAKAYFDYVNQQGGVYGRKIKLITLDDAYNTPKGVANAKQLIEGDKVFALFNMISSATNVALIPIINEAQIPNIAPYTGAEALRTPFNPLIFHVRASYADELEALMRHLDTRGVTKIAVLYQNNGFGKDGVAAMKAILAKRKLEMLTSVTIESDASDVAKAVAAIMPSKPQAIVMITAGKASAEFIKAYKKQVFSMQFFTLSVMGSQATLKALGADGGGVVVSQVGPYPYSGTDILVREYQRVMKIMGVKNYSFASMEGYLDAKVTVEGLKRAGKNLTRKSFIRGMESMHKVDLDGYVVDFSETSHQGSHFVDLNVISRFGQLIR